MNIKTKLVVTSALLGVIPAAILALFIGLISIQSGETILETQATNKLIALRDAKRYEIENYILGLESQIVTYSDDRMIINAMNAFKPAFHRYTEENTFGSSYKSRSDLRNYYESEFLARYKTRNVDKHFDVDGTLASLERVTIALQANYIANNANPLGSKDALNSVNDGSEYSRVHSTYHKHIRHFLQRFGYYDIFMVDPDTGHVIYSVFKELDYATSLVDGPYAKTGLGEAFRQANGLTGRDDSVVIDFAPYTPSYEDPASFIASPIFDGDKKVGILIFQMPVDRINEIMTYDQDWQNRGLGGSGETYLVGADYKMRSLGRFIVDDKQGYLQALRDSGTDSTLLDQISLKETTIGLQEVMSSGSQKALKGEEGTGIFEDYRGVPVVSAFAPLDIKGLNWAILSEVDEAEAFEPVSDLRDSILTWVLLGLVLMGVLSTIVGHLFAKSILTPVYAVVDGIEAMAKEIDSGQCDLTRELQPGTSPLGMRLAGSFNQMLSAFAKMINRIMQSSHKVSDASSSLITAASATQAGIIQQRGQATQTVEAVEEMQILAEKVSLNAVKGAQIAQEVDAETQSGADVVKEIVSQMRTLSDDVVQASEIILQLEQDSVSIGSVMDVIQGIAEQTNLLALNAAIEAARAGEQGRGFAVVADEVRSLASRTQESTAEIKSIIDSLQSRSKQAVNAMTQGREKVKAGVVNIQQAGDSLNEIAQKVTTLQQMTVQIADVLQEQTSTVNVINERIDKISEISESNSHVAHQSNNEAEALSSLADDLQKRISGYRVSS